MTVEYRRYTASGHRLRHSRSGAQDAYARGDCECDAWTYRGWTHYRADVIRQHNSHVQDVLEAKGWKVFTVNRIYEIFAANAKAAAKVRARERRIPGMGDDAQEPQADGENAWIIDGRRYVVTERIES